jgi:hypothetical protein
VPVDELVLIKEAKKDVKKKDEDVFILPNANEDLPMDQMTIRDLAAIFLNKPVSTKQWLNDLINKK